jgi:hypothetical protein
VRDELILNAIAAPKVENFQVGQKVGQLGQFGQVECRGGVFLSVLIKNPGDFASRRGIAAAPVGRAV